MIGPSMKANDTHALDQPSAITISYYGTERSPIYIRTRLLKNKVKIFAVLLHLFSILFMSTTNWFILMFLNMCHHHQFKHDLVFVLWQRSRDECYILTFDLVCIVNVVWVHV